MVRASRAMLPRKSTSVPNTSKNSALTAPAGACVMGCPFSGFRRRLNFDEFLNLLAIQRTCEKPLPGGVGYDLVHAENAIRQHGLLGDELADPFDDGLGKARIVGVLAQHRRV